MEDKVRFSVIIPFYKGEKHIKTAIESVISQPVKDIEIILINDGSPSGTEFCERIAKTNPQVKYYSKENEGIGATRNFGISKATGEYLAFLDQDDIWAVDFLNEETAKQIFDGGDIVGFSFYNCNSDCTRGNLVRMTEKTVQGGIATVMDCKNHHSSMWFKNTLLQNLDIRYALTRQEDVIFLQRALYVAEKITYIDKVMFLYRNNLLSETHRTQAVEALYGPILKSWEELLEWHRTEHPTDDKAIFCAQDMICVYAIEGVQALYQTNIDVTTAERIIDEYLARTYLNDFQKFHLYGSVYDSIYEYNFNRSRFIQKCRKNGKRNAALRRLKSIPMIARFYEKKRYSSVMAK